MQEKFKLKQKNAKKGAKKVILVLKGFRRYFKFYNQK